MCKSCGCQINIYLLNITRHIALILGEPPTTETLQSPSTITSTEKPLPVTGKQPQTSSSYQKMYFMLFSPTCTSISECVSVHNW